MCRVYWMNHTHSVLQYIEVWYLNIPQEYFMTDIILNGGMQE
jgi:hypothetical protein